MNKVKMCMNSLMMVLVFLLGASSLQAKSLAVDGDIAQGLAEASVVSVKKAIERQVAPENRGIEHFKTTMKTNPLYSMLLALETELPQITKTLEFVVMFNELHELNQQMQKYNSAITAHKAETIKTV